MSPVCSECERLAMTTTTAFPELCWHHHYLNVAISYLLVSLIRPGGAPGGQP